MAKVSFLDIPSGLQAAYSRVLQPGDRFTNSRVYVKQQFLSRQRIKGITQRSFLVSLAPVWAALTGGEQSAWNAAAALSGLTGWKLFVYDTVARRKAGFTGYATPVLPYQAMVGEIAISGVATGLLIEQPHPLNYYVYKKVIGTRSQYNPVAVTEAFGFPLEIGISWQTSLTALDGLARARMYVEVISSYQGRDIVTLLQIPFGLNDTWRSATATLSTVVGPVRSYSAYIEVYHCTGTLLFDNVSITHTGHNWARDPDCNNVAQAFTNQYEQIPKHWAPLNMVDGAQFGSVYFNDTVDHSLDLLEIESAANLLDESSNSLALESYA
jgi:hypothetical protein